MHRNFLTQIFLLHKWYMLSWHCILIQKYFRYGDMSVLRQTGRMRYNQIKTQGHVVRKAFNGHKGIYTYPNLMGGGNYAFHYQTFAPYLLPEMKRVFGALTWIIPARFVCRPNKTVPCSLIFCVCMIFVIFWYLGAIVKKRYIFPNVLL